MRRPPAGIQAVPDRTIPGPDAAWASGGAIALASDHAGPALRAALAEALRAAGWRALDLGSDGADSVDYPDFARRLTDALAHGRAACGVLVCGTGIGMSIAANRFLHIRAALCRTVADAEMARRHNDANVLVLGARVTDAPAARACLAAFLAMGFEGGRHARRVAKMA